MCTTKPKRFRVEVRLQILASLYSPQPFPVKRKSAMPVVGMHLPKELSLRVSRESNPKSGIAPSGLSPRTWG